MKNSQKGFVVPIFLIIALLVVSGGVYVYKNKKIETSLQGFNSNTQVVDTKSATQNRQVKEIQSLVNSYSVCVKAGDVNCMCKFMTSYHCGVTKKYGDEPYNKMHPSERHIIVDNQVIKELRSVQGFQDNLINNGILTEAKIFLLRMPLPFKESGVTFECLSVSFVKEDGQWKIYDPDPTPTCEI
ncbi:MAG: hypothetical protein WC673_02310 [Candidatus Paceibacterota bacterium]|jgi:hypothetical protein